MGTTSFTAVRRLAGFAITLLFSLCLCGQALGQGAAPPVTASSAVGLSHPTGWGAIQQTAIDAQGDWLVVDYSNGALYEFPAGGGAAIVLAAPGAPGASGSLGSYNNPGIVIDPANNLYLEANWNNCLLMFPWDAATGTWTGLSTMTPSNQNTAICTNSGKGNGPNAWAQYGIGGYPQGYFQPWGLAIGINNTLLIGNQNSNNFIVSFDISGAWANPTVSGAGPEPILAMTKRPISVAEDPEGNVYFVEDSGGLVGVYEIPAGTVNLASDAGLTRVDPNLPSPSGVITDAAGNLYISDSTAGVFMVPNPAGTPQTSASVMLSAVPAQGEVAIDWARNLMYVPTKQQQSNGKADVAMVGFASAEFGTSPVGTATTAGPNVVFGFNASATPSRFIIVEDGVSNPDFAITGGTCTTGTAYAANTGCLQNVAFKPNSVGSISARLLMQTAAPEGTGSPDASDSVTAWSSASGILTITAANSLVAGELIQFSAPSKTDALHGLDGQQFNVLAAGLSATQFEIQTSDVTSTGPTGTSTTSATLTGYVYSTAASIMLHGTGVGANIQTGPALEIPLGAGLKTPTQIALDGHGNTFVADPGAGAVEMFAAGSGTSGAPSPVGKGLTAPTGVAVDGTGDIFIADYSSGIGSVYEIPYAAPGRNSDGGQLTLVSGLGANLNLAADGRGNVYIADPTNGRVVKLSAVGAVTSSNLGQAEVLLTAGFTAPSAVAVDENGNLYVIDGANLFELAGGSGTPTTLLNNLSGATGLAVDPSGAVYITSAAGTTRIPSIGGVLVPANATPVAPDVSSTSAVALDNQGNAYLTAPTGGAITVVSINGALVLPTPTTLTSSTTSTATITNSGNAPLLVTGYTSTNPVDYNGADGTCVNDSTAPGTGIAAGGTCTIVVTLDPGPGEQGTLTGQIGVTSDAVNSPIVINATGSGLPLAGSATAISASGTAQVIDSPVTITVAPKATSTVVPTGEITVSYPSWTVVIPSSGPNAGVPTINPVTNTVSATLDVTGKASFQLAPVLAGNQTLTVAYSGDRVYGRSTGTVNLVVAKSAVSGIALPTFPDASDINLPFVVPTTGNGTVPYDGTELPWQYQFKMVVNTAFGVPTGQITMMDNSSSCPPGTSTSGLGAAACAMSNYSGVACPQAAGAAVLTIENSGTLTGAQTSFPTACLWNVPSGTTYSPVIYTHYVTPVYSGDANFLAYTGPTPTLFQAVRGPVVQITQTGVPSTATVAPSLTVSAGSSASIHLTLTSILGYGIAVRNGQLNDSNFPVSISCDMPIPHAQCAVTYNNTVVDPNQVTAPNSVQIPCPSGASTTQIADGSVSCTPGQATVTVYTDVSVGTTTSQLVRNASSVSLAAIFGLGMIGLFFRRRDFDKARRVLTVLLMLVGTAFAVMVCACSTTNLSPETALNTPPGTYQMTITAQEVGTQCIAQNGAGANCTTTSGSPGVLVYGSQNQVSLPFYVNVTVQ